MHAVHKLDVGDASSALELIRKACLPEEARSALVERMAEKMYDQSHHIVLACQPKMQKQFNMCHYLTDNDWNSIEQDTLSGCLQALARRAAFIGCHHPTEQTSARIASISLVRYGTDNALTAVRDLN